MSASGCDERLKASRALVVVGTRPEAIKMAPLICALKSGSAAAKVLVDVCITGQHRELLDPVLKLFSIKPDFNLDVMRPGQDLTDVTTRVMTGLREVFAAASPRYDLVLVQGDTTTTMAAALASFYADIPVAHVEAGLRTGHMRSPFPEELNRIMVSRMASIHFCPTTRAQDALLREGIDRSQIIVTGNTGIDALQAAVRMLNSSRGNKPGNISIPDTQAFLPSPSNNHTTELSPTSWMDPSKRTILVTCHRRESLIDPAAMDNICQALETLVQARADVQVVFPVHPNPALRQAIRNRFSSNASIVLLEPLEYLSFVQLLDHAYMVITDSGGIQEEAPCLGKPVLVIREVTERVEAVEAGTVIVTGTRADDIVKAAMELLDNERAYQAMARAVNPYGDGHAAPRIVDALLERGLL